jgi:LuxR family transcriptional regulator, maltose regulon positive regulatory protein
LAVATDEPETALRLLGAVVTVDALPGGWFADQFAVATAEAWLAACEPQQAIAALRPEPEHALADAKLALARALRLAGEFEAAEQVLARVPSDVVEMPLVNQVKRSLLAAELAVARGDRKRAEFLVDHALRTASREQLRSTVGLGGSWLRLYVAREPDLSDRYSAFVASVPRLASPGAVQPREDAACFDGLIAAPLTKRETDVLIRLAELCTNEEIAAELVLSLNTVKTHMRSLFQKLSVTRRADAVRRGRALGLC